jgi:hypothetical protein
MHNTVNTPLLQSFVFVCVTSVNLVPRACDPREGTRGSGIVRCRKPGILATTELRIPYQRPIRFLPGTDYPRASRSFPRIAGSGNEIGHQLKPNVSIMKTRPGDELSGTKPCIQSNIHESYRLIFYLGKKGIFPERAC